MESDEGTYKWGVTTSQAYFPKDFGGEFDNDYNITEWLTQYSEEKDVTYVRGFLGRMLFSGEDGVKKVAVLSGCEKVRCLLSKMMISSSWIFSRARFLEVACLDLEAFALNREINSCSSLIFSSFFLLASFI